MCMASMRESRDSDRFLVNTQVQSHALLCQGFGTSVPFIFIVRSEYYFMKCCKFDEHYTLYVATGFMVYNNHIFLGLHH